MAVTFPFSGGIAPPAVQPSFGNKLNSTHTAYRSRLWRRPSNTADILLYLSNINIGLRKSISLNMELRSDHFLGDIELCGYITLY